MKVDFNDNHITITFLALQELLDRSQPGSREELLANQAIQLLLKEGYWPVPR